MRKLWRCPFLPTSPTPPATSSSTRPYSFVIFPGSLNAQISSFKTHNMDQIAALGAEVFEACVEHERGRMPGKSYKPAVRVRTEFFVKFGVAASLLPEIATQKYFYEHAVADKRFNVPRIYYVYLVMEFIGLVNTPVDFVAQTAEAVVWLASVLIMC
jgi:hypothetical protein